MILCEYPECGNEIPDAYAFCPHCGRPGLYPNVRAAGHKDELAALEQRYTEARRNVDARGCGAVADAFLRAIESSKAVIARPLGELERLTRSDREVYSTYYKQIEAALRLPDGRPWDPLRRIAEEALFPGYKEEIRFAALTLDDLGPRSYGACCFTLREPMIAHRATIFEENNVLFMKRRDFKLSELSSLPPGYRSIWADRGKLCLAKLAGALEQNMREDEFAGLLLRPGKTTEDDGLVEVHVWGPITIRAIDKVILTRHERGPAAQAKLRAWREKLQKQYGVTLEVRA
jgi:hypothetical protein